MRRLKQNKVGRKIGKSNYSFTKEEHKQVTKILQRLNKEELKRCTIKGI